MKLSLSTLRPRDRRALLLGCLALVAYATFLGIRGYASSLGQAREQLATERELLARELGMLQGADVAEERLQLAAARFATRSEAMFAAADSLAAVSELSAYLQDVARESRVHVEHVESRSSSAETSGLVTLIVALRGRSDLRGIVDFMNAVRESENLIRVEQLSISRLPGSGTRDPDAASPAPDVQVLEFSALMSGYALPADPTPPAEAPE